MNQKLDFNNCSIEPEDIKYIINGSHAAIVDFIKQLQVPGGYTMTSLLALLKRHYKSTAKQLGASELKNIADLIIAIYQDQDQDQDDPDVPFLDLADCELTKQTMTNAIEHIVDSDDDNFDLAVDTMIATLKGIAVFNKPLFILTMIKLIMDNFEMNNPPSLPLIDTVAKVLESCRSPLRIQEEDGQLNEYQQSEDDYVRRRSATSFNRCRFITLIKYNDPDIASLAPILADTEQICALEDDRSKDTGLINTFKKELPAPTEVNIELNDDEDVFRQLLELPLRQYVFTGTDASDDGGVSRHVFSMAGRYIESNYMILKGNRYYFNGLKKGCGQAIAHILRLALANHAVIGISLSYGILYCIRNGVVATLDNMTLPILIYLYWKDSNQCRDTLRALLDPDYWIDPKSADDQLKESSRIMGFLLKKELNSNDRLEWLRRFLFGHLFGTLKEGKLKHNPELDKFLAPLSKRWDADLQRLIKHASLDRIAEITGINVTVDDIYRLIKWNATVTSTIKDLVKRYLAESDANSLRRFLIFVTGSVDTTQNVEIVLSDSGGLPTSLTCHRILELNRQYTSYEELKRDMDIALSEETFGLS